MIIRINRRMLITIFACTSALCAKTDMPAPINPFNGTQDRETIFEFTKEPAVEKKR